MTNAEVEAWIPALSNYANHVRAYWPRPCMLKFGLPPTAETWQILVLDDSDQAGALGYHDYTPGGRPISKVFAKTDLDNGYSPTVTLTHELAEMLADPWISQLFQVTNTKLYAQEIGDPVEADQLGYKIGNILVSDFITPAWFIPGHPGPVYDHARHCTAPLQVLPGGYMSIYVSGSGWTQVNAQGKEVTPSPSDPRFRDREGDKHDYA